MKKSITLALVFLGIAAITHAQNTIVEARGMVNSVITVKGIVTNGNELGTIRYFQDNTAGIAAYALNTTQLDNVKRGDSVTITGTLVNYKGLLEMNPLTVVVVMSSGNPLPDPIVLTPAQVGETYEGRLVQINDASFNDAGGVFAGNKTYVITANGASVNIYVKTGQNIVGQPIPNGLVNLTAVLSQFSNTSIGGYQLLPRDINDLHKTSAIYLTGSLNNTNFTKTELDFDWATNIAGTTEMFYGISAATVKSNKIIGTGGATSHSIGITGLSSGQIFWAQAFSVSGTDTAFSGIKPFATISNSSGDMKAYFNTPVDNSYSTGVNAVYLNQSIDDTLINYINRAKYSIDLAIYNFNNSGISNISTALNAASTRGVTVRVIGCGTSLNLGMNELTGSNMHLLRGPDSPPRMGIMHNKFMLFDTESADPNDPLVWTGSTNLTTGNINVDANNVIIIQDQSLARGYKIEFVESYFSPTDGVNSQIVQHINTANHDVNIATMLLTRTEIANAIAASKTAGNIVNMLTDNASSNIPASINTSLLSALGASSYVYYGKSGTMHNKYMIIDQGAPESSPQVWTGSHNWSAGADNENDENTLVIHDATIANIYYQNFVKLFKDSNGVITGLSSKETSVSNRLLVYPNPVLNGKANISCYTQSADNGTIQLIDVTGKIVFEKAVILKNGDNILDYSFPGSHKGLYIIKVTTAKSMWNQKVLFE